jgi:hypothetical protein
VTRIRQLATPKQGRSPVRLHIENLVLRGFAPADRRRIADRVQSELVRLMTDGHPMPSLKEPSFVERNDGGTIRISAGGSPQATGKQIAHAIYRSLQQSTAVSNGLPVMQRKAMERDGKR